MKNTLKLDNLKEWLLNKNHLALPMLLLLFFLIFVTISQLPVTLAQEDDGQAVSLETSGSSTSAVHIPDPNLEAAIRNALKKPGGVITRADMESLTELDASNIDDGWALFSSHAGEEALSIVIIMIRAQ